MISFFQKTTTPIFEGLCDIHNHLLPGIDDGSKSVTDSIKMLELYKELGFVRVYPTPHIYKELYPNTPQSIEDTSKLLKEGIGQNLPEIGIAAAEYMLDEHFTSTYQQKSPEMLLPGGLCLIEIHFFGDTEGLKQMAFTLLQNRVKPVLAHPERYHAIQDLSTYQELKDRGVLLQLNALSLLGHYGEDVKQKAFKLLDKGLYDYLGTDAHRAGHLNLLHKIKLSRKRMLSWEAIRERQIAEFGN